MLKLLVADDDRQIAGLLESFFRTHGYDVYATHGGHDALALIQHIRPHIVFLDLKMPDVSGLEVLRHAKALDPTMKVIVITALEDEENQRQAKALGADDYVIKPFDLQYLQDKVLGKVYASLYEDVRHANTELRASLERLQLVFRGIVKALTLVLSKIDPHYTSEHTARSVEYAALILRKLRAMGVDIGEEPEEIMLAGILLHDIGKIFTPREILYKEGSLTAAEWAIMRRHPVEGAEILEQIVGLKEMADIVRSHQECYDGTGYPDGLKGEEIPLGSRVAAVVDAFDAMVTDRPYRKSCSVERAIAELQRCRGAQFDPPVVDAMVSLYEEGLLDRVQSHASHTFKPPEPKRGTQLRPRV